MLSTVAVLALTPAAYGFNPGFSRTYAVTIGFDGFLPVFGGKEGRVQVDLALAVQGLLPSNGNLRASSDISDFKLQFNGAEFPLDLGSVKTYFPKTTVSLTKWGRILETDAPDIQLPVRLPGLDVKRFPDVTFLPVEFPLEGVEQGKGWTFTKSFGTGQITYRVTPSEVTDETITMDVRIAQDYVVLEDSSYAVVEVESDAESRVATKLSGAGTVVFDRKLGAIQSQRMEAVAVSDVTNLKDKSVSQRKLATSVRVRVAGAEGLPALRGSVASQGPLERFSDQVKKGVSVQGALISAKLMHPANGNRRPAPPLLAAAVNKIYVPGKASLSGKVQDLSVLAGQTASRIPKMFDKDAIKHLGSMIGGFTAIAGEHWRPHHERFNRLGEKWVQHIFANDSRTSDASRQSRR